MCLQHSVIMRKTMENAISFESISSEVSAIRKPETPTVGHGLLPQPRSFKIALRWFAVSPTFATTDISLEACIENHWLTHAKFLSREHLAPDYPILHNFIEMQLGQLLLP